MKPNIVNIFQYGKENIINMFGALVHFIQQNSKFLRTNVPLTFNCLSEQSRKSLNIYNNFKNSNSNYINKS